MGMFDYITYKGNQYQSKDTPVQVLDNYELREDGTLWYENYDGEWIENDGHFGYLKKNNIRWEHCKDFTGIISFYRSIGKEDWEEFEGTFAEGKLIKLREI